MAQKLVFLPPTWETQTETQAPGFGWAQESSERIHQELLCIRCMSHHTAHACTDHHTCIPSQPCLLSRPQRQTTARRQAQPTPRSQQAQGTFLGKTSGVLGGAVDFRAGTGNTQDKERTSCVRKEMLKNSSGHVTTRGTITKEIRMVEAVKSSVGRQL